MSAPAPGTDPLVRMLTLLPWLRSRGPVELAEAAAHFGVPEDRLRQELATLTFVGPGQGGGELVDISYEDGLVVVHDSQGLEFPLRLSAAEAASLITGLSLLTELAASPGDADAAASALAKLEEAVGAATGPVVTVPAAGGSPEVERAVREALSRGTRLRIAYASAARDELTEREVDPIRLVVVEGRTYLEGWCHRAEGVRLFRLDRVVRAEGTDAPAVVPAGEPERDPGSARVPAGEDVRLHLRPAAADIAELRTCVDRQALPDGSLVVTLRVADPEWLVRLLLSLGGDAELLERPDALQRARERAELALAAYRTPTGAP